MAGTKIGGLRAATTNRARHGKDFYQKIGAKGGRNGTTGGFAVKVVCNCPMLASEHFKHQCAAAKGGRASRCGSQKYPASNVST